MTEIGISKVDDYKLFVTKKREIIQLEENREVNIIEKQLIGRVLGVLDADDDSDLFRNSPWNGDPKEMSVYLLDRAEVLYTWQDVLRYGEMDLVIRWMNRHIAPGDITVIVFVPLIVLKAYLFPGGSPIPIFVFTALATIIYSWMSSGMPIDGAILYFREKWIIFDHEKKEMVFLLVKDITTAREPAILEQNGNQQKVPVLRPIPQDGNLQIAAEHFRDIEQRLRVSKQQLSEIMARWQIRDKEKKIESERMKTLEIEEKVKQEEGKRKLGGE